MAVPNGNNPPFKSSLSSDRDDIFYDVLKTEEKENAIQKLLSKSAQRAAAVRRFCTPNKDGMSWQILQQYRTIQHNSVHRNIYLSCIAIALFIYVVTMYYLFFSNANSKSDKKKRPFNFWCRSLAQDGM